MFRGQDLFSHIKCPEALCQKCYCPFNHNGDSNSESSKIVQPAAKPSKSYQELSQIVELEISKWTQRNTDTPNITGVQESNTVLAMNAPDMIPEQEENGSTDAEFSEDETEEEVRAREDRHQKYLEKIKKQKEVKKQKELQVKQVKEKQNRKRKQSSDIENPANDERDDQKSISKKGADVKNSNSLNRKEDVKDQPTKAIKLQNSKKPAQGYKSDQVNFSKNKVADSKSEESAALLRPAKEKLKVRNPVMELLTRQAEKEEPKKPKVKEFRSGEWDPLKASNRIAHSTNNSTRMNVVPIPNCPIPSAKRYQVLTSLHKESHRLYHTNEAIAKQVSLEQEVKLATRSKNKAAYSNLAAATIKRFRAARIGQPNAKEFMPQLDMSKIPANQSMVSVLSDEKTAKSMLKKQNSITRLSGSKFYAVLKPYVLSEADLIINNYPIPSAEDKRVAVINDMSRFRQKITGHPTKRICIRCGKEFFINENDEVSGGECAYHAGKLYSDRTSHHYSCCQGNAGSDPCKYADTHVHEENKADLTGYSSTASFRKVQECDKSIKEPGVYGLDCEMIYTTLGMELARVTIVNDTYHVVLDKYVKPQGRVLDLNEKYSGIKAESIDPKKTKKCAKSLRDVRKMVRAVISDECYILGHSLESDLTTLKLCHMKCIDTSVVFPHKKGLPYKRALKTLMQENCGLVIQQEDESDNFGHDSAEDAIACMKLMIWKIEQDQRCGKLQLN